MPDPTRDVRSTAPTWWGALAIGVAAALVAKRPLAQGQPVSARPGAARPQRDGTARSGTDARAAAPTEFTPRNWKSIALRVYGKFGENRVLAVAASITFYCLLALFPAIAALVSLYGLFADPATISDQLNNLTSFLPGGAIEIIGDQVKRISSKPHGSLSFGVVVGLLVALWSANAGVKAVFDALNIVYDEKEKRNFFVLNAVSLLCTVGALVIVLLALGAVVVVPAVLNVVGLGPVFEALIGILRWPILLVIIMGALSVLYRFGPSRTAPRWRWVTWGGAFAAIAWVIGSAVFSFYVSHFGSYNATYGSLGAAIGFMTWIWISSIIVLLGAEINAEMEHQTARDTTAGQPKPLGARGAAMADTVAR
jgi:membrane protein